MTPQEFGDLFIRDKAELQAVIPNGQVDDLMVSTYMILKFNKMAHSTIFNEINSLQTYIRDLFAKEKSDIVSFNKEHFALILEKLDKIEKELIPED